MSINFHAFQSRGVPFDEYEVVSEQWRRRFSGYDPERICRILQLEADEEYLYIPYLGISYRLNLENGRLEKLLESEWCSRLDFNESMAVYHLLYHTIDVPTVSGKWVPNYAIDGVVSRSGRTSDPLFGSFCRRWSGQCAALAQACERAGGKMIPCGEHKGDVGFQFEVLPYVGMRLVFWDADEDFPAQVQILLDQKVLDFVHYETVGCVISDLFEKLSIDASKSAGANTLR